ncbi:hypothetical protein [Acetoanaerobium noterae]|uniref:hypothetical protein n=1 Tax=Acetoanaerobium noterae TaxID=745369 RepID=UPI003333E519
MIVKDFDFTRASKTSYERAEIMVKGGLHSRFNLSRKERVEKAHLGCLGELAFEHFLRTKGIAYKLDDQSFENRNSDEFDFLINDKKIDAKVAKKTTSRDPNDNWTYGYPQEQHPATKNYVVVGWVDFEKSEIGFYGWITGQKIATFPVVERNSYAGYRYLTPNHEFKWGELNKDFESLFNTINNSSK